MDCVQNYFIRFFGQPYIYGIFIYGFESIKEILCVQAKISLLVFKSYRHHRNVARTEIRGLFYIDGDFHSMYAHIGIFFPRRNGKGVFLQVKADGINVPFSKCLCNIHQARLPALLTLQGLKECRFVYLDLFLNPGGDLPHGGEVNIYKA